MSINHSSEPKLTTGQEYEQLRTIFQRDLRILGNIGNKGQKEQISNVRLSRQIQSALDQGYSEKEVIDTVIRAITPGLPLREYLEAMREKGLQSILEIISPLSREKCAELFASLANLAQAPGEGLREFLLRALNMREKVIFASKQESAKLRYDPEQCRNLFLHTVETGLLNNNLRSRLRPFLKSNNVKDEDLIAEVNIALTEESERNRK